MEKIILVIINALGSMGEKYAHIALDGLEEWARASEIANAIFYKAVGYIQSWEPKNPTE
jgi:hypothetical protein